MPEDFMFYKGMMKWFPERHLMTNSYFTSCKAKSPSLLFFV